MNTVQSCKKVAAEHGTRNTAIDGWRGIAASMVVFAHAVNFRFAEPHSTWVPHRIAQLAEPFSALGVQIFFVISGYIITTLLLSEQRHNGKINIGAFYVRRTFRIIPPLAVYIATIAILNYLGFFAVDNQSFWLSSLFLCNTSIGECNWFVAHTWSLAVEEQFYLVWPALLVLSGKLNLKLIIAILLAMMLGFVVQQPLFQSNFLSFACIAAGVTYAFSPWLQSQVTRFTHLVPWAIAVIVMVIGPFTPLAFAVRALLPLLVVYVVFAGTQIPLIRAILNSKPLQVLGFVSYSLYLWQQLFLATPPTYLGLIPHILLLPLVVALSVYLVEQPMIAKARVLSAKLMARSGDNETAAKAT